MTWSGTGDLDLPQQRHCRQTRSGDVLKQKLKITFFQFPKADSDQDWVATLAIWK